MSDTLIRNFPQARLDEMMRAAKNFDRQRPPANLPWRFDTGGQMDGAESAFIAEQLMFMRPGVFEVQYPDLTGMSLCPVNTSADRGARDWGIEVMDQVGQVKVSQDMAGDTPMVEVSARRAAISFFTLRLGYQYSQDEADAAIYARIPLNQRKAMAVREQLERKLDDIIFVGETTTGITGILNQSAADTYTPTADGAGGAKTFDSKSADQVINDLNAPADQIVSNTKGVEIPDTLLLPLTTRNSIARRRVGDGTSVTILNYFTENSQFVKTVAATYKSETSGSGSTKRSVTYRKDPNKLEAIVSVRFDQLPPQYHNFSVVTHCWMRTAGVALYQPKSMCYSDGI